MLSARDCSFCGEVQIHEGETVVTDGGIDVIEKPSVPNPAKTAVPRPGNGGPNANEYRQIPWTAVFEDLRCPRGGLDG